MKRNYQANNAIKQTKFLQVILASLPTRPNLRSVARLSQSLGLMMKHDPKKLTTAEILIPLGIFGVGILVLGYVELNNLGDSGKLARIFMYACFSVVFIASVIAKARK